MQDKSLHIVSFDNPYPPNYGGVIDVFFKVKALHELGYTVFLHCFVKEIPTQFSELEAITSEVYFYKVSMNPFFVFSQLPFSVISRSNKQLVDNILKNDAPILFENLKTTCSLHDVRLKSYKKFLRLHNIEQNYFKGIAKSEKQLKTKFIHYLESYKYKKYESIMSSFEKVITLSEHENDYVNAKFHNGIHIPVFHGNETILNLSAFGEYVLYHGDLNTSDNRRVVSFLVDVFAALPQFKLVVTSGSQQEFVEQQIGALTNIQFVKLVDFDHLQEIFQKAHINISWSFQKSGTKLKLINSLFNSRFSIINKNIVDDDKISQLCIQVNDKTELTQVITELMAKPYIDFEQRKNILESHLSDIQNAVLLGKVLSEN